MRYHVLVAVGAVTERVIQIQEEHLAEDHPETAVPARHMAAWLKAQGKDAQAVPVLEKCIKVTKDALGTDHPQVGLSFSRSVSESVSRPFSRPFSRSVSQSVSARSREVYQSHPGCPR